MTLTVAMTTFDCHDPAGLAAWWAEWTGGTVTAVTEGAFVVVETASGAWLGFQRVDDPSPGKNRAHVDFRSEDRNGDVARLVAAGASEIERHQVTPGFGWVVLSDPEGNVFCVGG